MRCLGHKYTTYCTCLISTLFEQHFSWINLLQTTSSNEEPQTYLYELFTQWPQGLFGLSMTQKFKFMQMCTKLMQDARRMQTDPDCCGNLSKSITPSCYITYFMNVWKLQKEERKCWMLLATETDFVRTYTGHIFDCWPCFFSTCNQVTFTQNHNKTLNTISFQQISMHIVITRQGWIKWKQSISSLCSYSKISPYDILKD